MEDEKVVGGECRGAAGAWKYPVFVHGANTHVHFGKRAGNVPP
jgi:hypothetical protein